MTEVEAPQINEIKESKPSLFPIDKEIINDFFEQKNLKEVPAFNYRENIEWKIAKIENENPELFEEIFINSGYFGGKYLKKPAQINHFTTGATIMYEIFSKQAQENNVEMPIFTIEDFKTTEKTKAKTNSKYTNIEDFLFLEKTDRKTPQYEKFKRKKLFNDILVFTNEQPALLEKLKIPLNPSLFVGAAFVYGRFHKKMMTNDIVQ